MLEGIIITLLFCSASYYLFTLFRKAFTKSSCAVACGCAASGLKKNYTESKKPDQHKNVKHVPNLVWEKDKLIGENFTAFCTVLANIYFCSAP